MSQVLDTWSTAGNAGTPNNQIPGLPIWFAQFGLHFIGIPDSVAQIAVISTLSVLAALGTYFLTIQIMKSAPINLGTFAVEIGALAAGILWVANPAALAQVWYRQTFLDVTWAMLPWLALLFVQAASDSKDSLLKFFFRGLFVAVIGSAGLVEALLPGIALLILAWLSPMVIASIKQNRTIHLWQLAAASSGILVGIVWWLIPAIPYFKAIVKGTTLSPSSSLELAAFSPYLNIQKILTLTDAPLIWQSPGPNQPPFTIWSWIVTRPSSLIIFIIPAVVITGLFLSYRRWQKLTPSIMGAVVAILLGAIVTKGNNGPLSSIGALLIKIPYGSAFRDPASTLIFISALPICVLFGVGACSLVLRDMNWAIVGIACVVLIDGLVGFAWWTNAVIPRNIGVIPSEYVTVPKSYQSFANWTKQLTLGEKIMVLPYSRLDSNAFIWKSGADTGLDCVLPDFIVRQILLCGNSNVGLANTPGITLATDLASKEPGVFALAKLWGVGTWLIHLDWNYKVVPHTYSGPIAIRNLTIFSRSKISGNFDLGSRIFTSKELEALSQQALPLVYSPNISIESSAGASSQGALKVAESLVSGKRRGVEIRKRPGSPKCDNSASLTVNGGLGDLSGEIIGNGSVCFVFGETFDHGWQLILTHARTTIESHFRANWWQNGWVIRLNGKAEWHLIYHPQDAVNLGLDVGLFEWGICLIVAGGSRLRKFSRRPGYIRS